MTATTTTEHEPTPYVNANGTGGVRCSCGFKVEGMFLKRRWTMKHAWDEYARHWSFANVRAVK